MNFRSYGLSGTRLIAAAVLLAAALLLFAAALADPKQPSGAEWSPLNAEVQAALEELAAEEEKAEGSGLADEDAAAADRRADENTGSAAGEGEVAMTDERAEENDGVNADDRAENKADDVIEANADRASNGNAVAGITDHTSHDEADAEAGGGRLDINRATLAELDALKGIGPAKAEAIVKDREQNGKFGTVRDLLRVKGIGEKLLSGIEESIVARP